MCLNGMFPSFALWAKSTTDKIIYPKEACETLGENNDFVKVWMIEFCGRK